MQHERAEQYGRCAVVLDVDLDVPGAAAIFDQALTNGLTAIVAHVWPGDESQRLKNGHDRMKSASHLLDVITERCIEDGQGQLLIPNNQDKTHLSADVANLRDALDQTQRVRHGRDTGTLTKQQVTALLGLDEHVCLRQVSDERRESDWVKNEIRDRYEQRRAADYLELIGQEEVDRRIVLASDHVAAHPDDLVEGKDVVTCPVCNRETLAVTGIDDFGVGYGPGTCLACSYVFSSHAAHEEALSHMLSRHSKD
ncbi:hypothetical protein [Streptomonospora alba]|uniref:hypothetical protein n=1 Tax=Streptomonospora alba TaxID=183763 RepID=UPI0012EDCA86|nr:hypothetical protein [Streptomonospora alba]